MGSEIVYRRYRWKVVVIGLVLVAAGVPVVEWAHERLDEDAPVMRPLAKHDHAPDGPSPTRVQPSYTQAAGTASTSHVWIPTTPPGVTFRELDL